ncbi:MAG: hypothetical protein L6R38_009663 [Xanthoria sp. 2 TBL-2021]|nr:MAG: hypothetical protein L6R38_009663 [Xanthoria sp. 2 TBL-2021]
MASKRKDRQEISETPSPKRRRTTRTVASAKSINYDQKYHPMDDVTRPAAAAARRAAHGLSDTSGSSTTSDSTIINQSDDSSDDSLESGSSTNLRSGRSRGSNLSRPQDPTSNPETMRRPARARSGSPSNRRVTRGDVHGEKVVQYSAKHHPMDDTIRPKQAKKVLARTAAIANSSASVIGSPKSPKVSKPEPPYEAVSELGWKSLNAQDRLLFSLQKGAPPDGAMPMIWSNVAKALRKLGMPARSVDIKYLQQRYGTVCRNLYSYYRSAGEPANKEDQEFFYAEAIDLYDYEAGDKYWKHRSDNIVSLETPARVDRAAINLTEAGTDITDDNNYNEEDIGIRGGYGSYNNAEGYIRQSHGVFDSETQDSTETEVLSSLRNQLSAHIDDMLDLDELSQKFHSSANQDNESRKTTTINNIPAADDALQPESATIRGPLKRRLHNPRSNTQPPFSVHEDQPGNTPKIKRQLAMMPKSPGTDLPKENWSERSSSSNGSLFSTQE